MPPTTIPHLFYPHIIESIVLCTDYKTKLRCRATCRALRQYTDELLIADAVCVTREHGWPTVAPFSGTLYPFFSPEGDRQVQIQTIQRNCRSLRVRDVKASFLNPILSDAGPVEDVGLYHDHCHETNYQFTNICTLDVFPRWICSCNEHDSLRPPLSHTAGTVYIEFGMVSGVSEPRWHEVRDEVTIQAESASACHLLRYALNEHVTDLVIIIPFTLSYTSLEHLPLFVLPNGSTTRLNPELTLSMDFSLARMTDDCTSEEARDILKRAFASHLRISLYHVLVAFSGDSDYA